MFDKEAVHDEKINPLVEQIVKICQEEKIPCVMDFMIKEGNDYHDPLHCITALHGLEGMPHSPSIYMAIIVLREWSMIDKRWRLSHEMAESFEWDKWREEIPFIPFRKGWEIKIIPPRSGAVVRFLVREPGGDDISVYLDCYDILGCYGSPYWEIYPAADGDVERYKMEDVDGLLDGLERALEKIGENKEKYEKDRKIVQLEEQLESSRAECRLLRDLIEKVELAYNTLDERYRRLKDETGTD